MATQALTLRMIVSSLFGWLALSTTCAAFLPVIIMNATRMRVSSSPGFLWTWLFGDLVSWPSCMPARLTLYSPATCDPQTNLTGAILGHLPPTQLALAIWYTLVDVTMITQMFKFGHLDPLAPDPKPTKVFVKLRERKKKHPRWYKITVAFMSFSAWDDVKLLLFCMAGVLNRCLSPFSADAPCGQLDLPQAASILRAVCTTIPRGLSSRNLASWTSNRSVRNPPRRETRSFADNAGWQPLELSLRETLVISSTTRNGADSCAARPFALPAFRRCGAERTAQRRVRRSVS